jgi:chromosome segregation ATPase
MVISDLQKANKVISSALENLTLQLTNVTKKVDTLEVELDSNRNIIKEKELEVKYLKEQLSVYKSEDKSVLPLTQELIEPYFTQMKNSLDNNKESIFTKQAEFLNTFHSQMKELENKLSSILNNISNLQSKIDSPPDRSHEVADFEAKYHDLKMVSTELAEKSAKLEEERERNELTISNLQTQIDENENLIKTIQDEAATLIREKNQIQEQFNTISDSESSEERLNLIRDEFKEVEEKYLKESSELKAELEILREFKNKTISTVETEEIKEDSGELKAKIENLESENNSLHKQIQTFDRIIGDIKKAEEELDSETSLKEEEISFIHSEKEGLIGGYGNSSIKK